MKKIALLGFGTVGKGTYKILTEKKDKIAEITGEEIHVKKILKRNLNFETDLPRTLFTDSYSDIINDDEISLVCEMTGDIEASYYYIKDALLRGKHVVSANKAVVAAHLNEFLNLARENNVKFLFEASCLASVPVVEPMKRQAAVNDIKSICGIFNGTSNYILSRMYYENRSYDEILKHAQEIGYAESDPYDDVEGLDALRKLKILSLIAYGINLENNHIFRLGMSKIKQVDIEFFRNRNQKIKLVASSDFENGCISASVIPTVVEEGSELYSVDYEKNILKIYGEYYNSLVFEGSGAGSTETGNAMVTDVIDAFSGADLNTELKNLYTLKDSEKFEYYIRTEKNLNISWDRYVKEYILSDDFSICITQPLGIKELRDFVSLINDENIFIARY